MPKHSQSNDVALEEEKKIGSREWHWWMTIKQSISAGGLTIRLIVFNEMGGGCVFWTI